MTVSFQTYLGQKRPLKEAQADGYRIAREARLCWSGWAATLTVGSVLKGPVMVSGTVPVQSKGWWIGSQADVWQALRRDHSVRKSMTPAAADAITTDFQCSLAAVTVPISFVLGDTTWAYFLFSCWLLSMGRESKSWHISSRSCQTPSRWHMMTPSLADRAWYWLMG